MTSFKTAAALAAFLLALPAAHAGQAPPPTPGQPDDIVPQPDIPTALPVDLRIVSIEMPDCVDPGDAFGSRVEVKIENLGAGAVNHDFGVTFEARSTRYNYQALLDDGRQRVAGGIDGNTQKSVQPTSSLRLPSGLGLGPHELIVDLDYEDNVEETDETNNIATTQFFAGAGRECP